MVGPVEGPGPSCCEMLMGQSDRTTGSPILPSKIHFLNSSKQPGLYGELSQEFSIKVTFCKSVCLIMHI